jgi:hypothetical protein
MRPDRITVAMLDEVFVLRQLCICIRIGELIGAVNEAEDLPAREFLTADLAAMHRSDGISQNHLAQIDAQRLREPLVVCELADEMWVVDGNHRLEKRRRFGLQMTTAVVVPPELLFRYMEPLVL